MKIKSLLIASAIASVILTISSCKTPQTLEKTTGAVEISVPFSESKYKTDKDFFRSVGTFTTIDIGAARDNAVANARERLAAEIKTTLSGATRRFSQSLDAGGRKEFEGKSTTQSWLFVDDILYNCPNIADKIFQNPDKTYTCWSVVEKSTKSILEGVNNEVSKDKKLELNYDQKKFAEEVEREKEKMSKDQ